MCLKFLCCGGDDADDGTPASQPVAKPPSSHTVQMPPASGQLPSSAMNGLPSSATNGLPSSATNGVKTPTAAGDNKSSPQEPGKFDTARKEGGKKSEKVSETTDNKPSSPIEKPNKKDESAKKGGQDADVRPQINQDHRLPSVDAVGSQANRGRISQDQERRVSTNEPIRSEALDYRFLRADDIRSPANLMPRKDQPRRGAHIY